MKTTPERIQIKHAVNQEEILSFEYPSDFFNQEGFRPFFPRRRAFNDFVRKGASAHFALTGGNVIIGYAVIGPSDETGYWGKLGEGRIQEVVAVEVLRQYRRRGVAGNILKGIFESGALDRKIVCLSGYSWTWDLVGTGISAEEYKQMLIHFYGKFGFRQYPTGEPNVNLKPENFLMARIGRKVTPQTIEEFNLARFGI